MAIQECMHESETCSCPTLLVYLDPMILVDVQGCHGYRIQSGSGECSDLAAILVVPTDRDGRNSEIELNRFRDPALLMRCILYGSVRQLKLVQSLIFHAVTASWKGDTSKHYRGVKCFEHSCKWLETRL